MFDPGWLTHWRDVLAEGGARQVVREAAVVLSATTDADLLPFANPLGLVVAQAAATLDGSERRTALALVERVSTVVRESRATPVGLERVLAYRRQQLSRPRMPSIPPQS